MSAFHTDEYVHFLTQVTPETAEKMTYQGTRCVLPLFFLYFISYVPCNEDNATASSHTIQLPFRCRTLYLNIFIPHTHANIPHSPRRRR
ncbi:hypothetical protein BJ165DRAFT_121368 [Panaeolus papilionaceus]|nr:hypothetical protein BJ165DRAFT_121368 [Panaeolus papilionaceus]